jgi:hypothetical protein
MTIDNVGSFSSLDTSYAFHWVSLPSNGSMPSATLDIDSTTQTTASANRKAAMPPGMSATRLPPNPDIYGLRKQSRGPELWLVGLCWSNRSKANDAAWFSGSSSIPPSTAC